MFSENFLPLYISLLSAAMPMRCETYIILLCKKLSVIIKCIIHLFVRMIPIYLVTFCLLLQGRTIQDVGTMLLRNVAAHLQNYPTSHPRSPNNLRESIFSLLTYCVQERTLYGVAKLLHAARVIPLYNKWTNTWEMNACCWCCQELKTWGKEKYKCK